MTYILTLGLAWPHMGVCLKLTRFRKHVDNISRLLWIIKIPSVTICELKEVNNCLVHFDHGKYWDELISQLKD